MPEKPQPAEAVTVFFSYAHEDEALRERLEQHFSFLKHERKIAHWHDGQIKAGEEWRGKIEKHLNAADVILLLISADFAHSDFCYSIEMTRAMEHPKRLSRVLLNSQVKLQNRKATRLRRRGCFVRHWTFTRNLAPLRRRKLASLWRGWGRD